MKLISPFHDYYDSAIAYGSDPLAIYKRKTSLEITRENSGLNLATVPWVAAAQTGWRHTCGRYLELFLENMDPDKLTYWDKIPKAGKYMELFEGFVLVSGKAYPVWLKNDLISDGILENRAGSGWLGTPSVSDAEKRFAQSIATKHPGIGVASRQRQSSRFNKKEFNAYDQARQKFLEQDFTDFHLNVGAPVVLLLNVHRIGRGQLPQEQKKELADNMGRGGRACTIMVLNPRLADLNFASVLDPATAFQEISRFVCGVAPGQQMPMVEISDQIKVEKKGFDPKYGFRTRPKVK